MQNHWNRVISWRYSILHKGCLLLCYAEQVWNQQATFYLCGAQYWCIEEGGIVVEEGRCMYIYTPTSWEERWQKWVGGVWMKPEAHAQVTVGHRSRNVISALGWCYYCNNRWYYQKVYRMCYFKAFFMKYNETCNFKNKSRHCIKRLCS